MDYIKFCEKLFEEWQDKKVIANVSSQRLFTLQHAPEPYLRFGAGEPRVIFVSTNPGVGFPFQEHPSNNSISMFANTTSYVDAAQIAGDFYSAPSSPINAASKANIRAMQRIAAAIGYKSVTQLEAIPWHSASLTAKKSTIDTLRRVEPRISEYLNALAAYLADQPVVLAWAAGTPSSRSGEGVELKAELLGIDLKKCEITALERTSEVSQALLWQRKGRSFRGIFVNRGSATLPKQLSRSGLDKDALIHRTIGAP